MDKKNKPKPSFRADFSHFLPSFRFTSKRRHFLAENASLPYKNCGPKHIFRRLQRRLGKASLGEDFGRLLQNGLPRHKPRLGQLKDHDWLEGCHP